MTRTFARRSLLLATTLSLSLGMVAVVGAAATADQPIAATVLNLVGGAFVSASVVTLVLGAMTVRKASAQVDSAVLRGRQDVLTPIRDPLHGSALASYRASVRALYRPPHDRFAAIAQLPFPLQPGSTIAFPLDRDTIPAQVTAAP